MPEGIWALCGLAVFAAVGPPVFVKADRTGAGHNALAVFMYPVGRRPNQYRPAVLAQEKAEWRMLWLFGIACGLIANFAWQAPNEHWAYVLLAAFLGNIFLRLATNGLDYVGHGVEIIVAEEAGWSDYRADEIERMRRNDGRSHMSPEQVSDKLDVWAWFAKPAAKFLTY